VPCLVCADKLTCNTRQILGSHCCEYEDNHLLHTNDSGGSRDLRNVGKFLPDYAAQHPRRYFLTFVLKMAIVWVVALCSVIEINRLSEALTASIIRAIYTKFFLV
jgi:hypothetical protein